MHTPHYSIEYTWCTLLIIPSTLHHAHSSLFHSKCLSISRTYTLLPMHRLQHSVCTLLVNLIDTHSSLFHRLHMMHTPHYSIKFTSCTLLIILQNVAEYIHDLHTPANEQRLWLHSPGKFTGCTLLIIPLNLHHAHSSSFPSKCLSISRTYTLLPFSLWKI